VTAKDTGDGDTGYEVRSSCPFRIMPIALGGTSEMRITLVSSPVVSGNFES